MESSGTRTGETADLVSPWIASKSEGQCLKFYYTMYGKTMGSLSIKVELSNDKSWFIFYKNGNQGMKWRKGTGNIEVPLGLWYRVRTGVCFFSSFTSILLSKYSYFNTIKLNIIFIIFIIVIIVRFGIFRIVSSFVLGEICF